MAVETAGFLDVDDVAVLGITVPGCTRTATLRLPVLGKHGAKSRRIRYKPIER